MVPAELVKNFAMVEVRKVVPKSKCCVGRAMPNWAIKHKRAPKQIGLMKQRWAMRQTGRTRPNLPPKWAMKQNELTKQRGAMKQKRAMKQRGQMKQVGLMKHVGLMKQWWAMKQSRAMKHWYRLAYEPRLTNLAIQVHSWQLLQKWARTWKHFL